jgi:molybdate transport system substrate-binding protein
MFCVLSPRPEESKLPFCLQMKRTFFFRLILSALIAAGIARAEPPLRVSAAASLSDALREIDAEFSKASGTQVYLNLGASSTLARQIDEGAPGDVFFSADQAKMDALAAKGLILAETREDQLSNSLVVVVPADSRLKLASIKDLTTSRVSKIATGDPKAVPVGVYARSYFEKAGLWADLQRKMVATENVRAALAAVESGNVDAGIVYKTDAAISKKVKVALEIPPLEGLKIVYPMAVLKGSTQPRQAQKYLEFLDSPTAKAIFEKYGFIVLPD